MKQCQTHIFIYAINSDSVLDKPLVLAKCHLQVANSLHTLSNVHCRHQHKKLHHKIRTQQQKDVDLIRYYQLWMESCDTHQLMHHHM
jgi:hypothetical protein